MQFYLSELLVLCRRNADMTSALLQVGTQIAPELHASSTSCGSTTPSIETTGDLLAALQGKPARTLSMLKTTCGHLGIYLDLPGDAIPLITVEAKRGGFRQFLEGRRYAGNSIRTYVNQVRLLLKAARKLGWDPDISVSDDWKGLPHFAAGKKIKAIVTYFSRSTKSPADVTLDDVEQWGVAALNDGLSYQTVVMQKSRFWHLLQDAGWTTLALPSQSTRKQYGIPLEQFPPTMKNDVQALLKWKQADFAINRPKRGKIRAVSADVLRQIICQLAGYVVNIRDGQLSSLAELFQQSVIEGFVEWSINERGMKGLSIKTRIGMVAAVVKNHTMFVGQDHSWFKTLADSIPLEDESERKKRKAEKYLEYEVLESIPAQIHTELEAAMRKNQMYRAAYLASEELLITWLLILPWRQRNLRECRFGGKQPNIFRGKISPFSDIDKPAWVVEQEAQNPEAEFWQIHFTPAETKTKVEVRAVLPKQLIKPLEEYLTKYRPELLNGKATVNLFLNRKGRAMAASTIRNIVEKWTFRCGGVRMNPHQARDSFAFRWLKEHPRDFLLLSKILWHRNIQTTIQIYGARFNVSSGMCALEEWLDERKARSK
jgi:integrase